ncbi:MAG: CvpA family protein [Dehalococcoidia bacterium]
MNWLDAAIVIIFLFFIVTAFSSGFVRETVSMGSTIAGGVLAGLLYDDVADTLLASIDNQTTAAVAGFLVIFVGVSVAGQAVAMLMKPAVNIMQLGIADQLMGAAFGAVKAFVIVTTLLILFVTYPRYDMDERIEDSEFASIMLEVSDPLTKVLPKEFESSVNQFNSGSTPEELAPIE